LLTGGDAPQARKSYQRALELAGSTTIGIDQARALEGIGRCDIAAGLMADGYPMLRQALEIYQRIGAAEAARLAEELGTTG
jgi:hypothetical protein